MASGRVPNMTNLFIEISSILFLRNTLFRRITLAVLQRNTLYPQTDMGIISVAKGFPV